MKEVRLSTRRGDIAGSIEIPPGPPEGMPGVVLLHGFTSDRNESPIAGTQDTLFQRASRRLCEEGFATLRIDFSGHGESHGMSFEDLDLGHLVNDALSGVSYLSQRPEVSPADLFLLGQSMGGLVAACAAHRAPRLRAVALWNAPSNPLRTLRSALGTEVVATALQKGVVEFAWDEKGLFRLKRRFFESLADTCVLEELARYPGRLLVVAGQRDQLVGPQPRAAEAFLRVHHGTQRLLVLDGDHTFDVTSGRTETLDQAIDETIAWFSDAIQARDG